MSDFYNTAGYYPAVVARGEGFVPVVLGHNLPRNNGINTVVVWAGDTHNRFDDALLDARKVMREDFAPPTRQELADAVKALVNAGSTFGNALAFTNSPEFKMLKILAMRERLQP